jgi:hypothetical protein
VCVCECVDVFVLVGGWVSVGVGVGVAWVNIRVLASKDELRINTGTVYVRGRRWRDRSVFVCLFRVCWE